MPKPVPDGGFTVSMRAISMRAMPGTSLDHYSYAVATILTGEGPVICEACRYYHPARELASLWGLHKETACYLATCKLFQIMLLPKPSLWQRLKRMFNSRSRFEG